MARNKIERICGIYKITNPVGKIYIGKSEHIFKRWNQSYERQRLILESLGEFGSENHIYEIVERCEYNKLDERERFWIAHFDTFDTPHGLNLTDGGKGFDFSKETKEILRKNATGNTNWVGRKHKESTKKLQSINSGQAKKVLNIDTGVIYKSATEASKCEGIDYWVMIRMVAGKNKHKQAKFKYLTPIELNQ